MMLQDYDAIEWPITKYMKLVRAHANIRIDQYNRELANPESSVWDDPEERRKRFPEEAYLAQMAELVINQFVHGPKNGMILYNKGRQRCNKRPFDSDGKTDARGFQLDVKCSGMRGSPYMSTYHLSVPPKDRQSGDPFKLIPENIFVLALVKKGDLCTIGPIEEWKMKVGSR